MIGFRINEINRSLNNVSDQKTNDKTKTTKVNIKTNFGSKFFMTLIRMLLIIKFNKTIIKYENIRNDKFGCERI